VHWNHPRVGFEPANHFQQDLSAVSRRYSKVDRLFIQFDRALRTSTGSTGRPAPSVGGVENPNSVDHRTLRQAHAALTIQTGLQAGVSVPGESPSSARQSALRASCTESALRDVTLTMQRMGVGPSILSPAFYAGALATGVASAITGNTATRALHADSRRRVRRALGRADGDTDTSGDESLPDPEVGAALERAREAIEKQNLSGVTAAHSAYEPRPSVAVSKAFDAVENVVSRIVDKI